MNAPLVDATSKPASQRWVEIRNAAGYRSNQALERACEFAPGTFWNWTNPGKAQRDPSLRSLRILSQRLGGISLDTLVEILMAWREELSQGSRHEGR